MERNQLPSLEITSLFEFFVRQYRDRKILTISAYLFFLIYFSLPSLNLPLLQYSGFRFTSLMEQRAIEANMLFYPSQSWIGIDEVNPSLLKAVISMEDGSFFNHKGIDWKELKTSLKLNKRRGRAARGGSTITMQTAKNLFLTTDKSILRKAKEFVVAFRMEKELSKRTILQCYINAIEWGEGIFGVYAASEEYFNKHPLKLSRNQSARLAAVIPSPLRFKPNENSGYVLRRSSIISARMSDVVLFPEERNEKKRPGRSDRRR